MLDKKGFVDIEQLKKEICSETLVVSVIHGNNEIGTIQPINEIAKAVRHKKKEYNSEIYFHTDASQAPLYLPLNTLKLGVDMMTLGGQKMYGPKGVGCLYAKKEIKTTKKQCCAVGG